MSKPYLPSPGALAVPPKKKGGANATNTPGHFARELAGIGKFPRSKRKVVVARTKGGLRPVGKEWSAADVSELFQRSDRFALFIQIAVFMQVQSKAGSLAAFTPDEQAAIRNGKADAKLATRAFVVYAADEIEAGRGRQVLSNIASVLEAITDLSNQSKLHPLDIVDFSMSSVLSQFSAQSRSTTKPVQSAMSGIGALGDPHMLAALRQLSGARKWIGTSGLAVFRRVARLLRNYEGQLFRGFYSRRGLRAWEPPKVSKIKNEATDYFLSRRVEKAVTGFQIDEIVYEIPMEFDDKGQPTAFAEVPHECAAAVAQRAAGKDLGQFSYALAMTPAGRLWLCFESGTNRWFLAADRKPSRPVFVAAAIAPEDAALAGLDVNKPITGLVI